MSHTSANATPPEPPPHGSSPVAWVVTALGLLLWISITFASSRIAPKVVQIANDVDLRYGITSSISEPE